MAMIPCPECGNTISDRVSKCPHCGYPMDSKKSRYSQFYEKPRPQTFQIEPQYEEMEERRSKQISSKSTALSVSAMIISFMGLLTSFIAIIIASGKPKEVYVEKEVPVYLEADQSQTDPDIKEPDINNKIIPAEVENEDQKEKEEPKEVEPEESKDSRDRYSVGETWKNKYVLVSYDNCGEYVSDNQFIQPADGNKYVYATFTFDNIGSSDKSVGYWDFDCYADGYACEGTYGADDSGFTQTLSPGRKITGSVYFEVPQNAKEIEFEYEPNFWASEKIVFVYQ